MATKPARWRPWDLHTGFGLWASPPPGVALLSGLAGDPEGGPEHSPGGGHAQRLRPVPPPQPQGDPRLFRRRPEDSSLVPRRDCGEPHPCPWWTGGSRSRHTTSPCRTPRPPGAGTRVGDRACRRSSRPDERQAVLTLSWVCSCRLAELPVQAALPAPFRRSAGLAGGPVPSPRALTPAPETAWASRTLSPVVWQRWAWCISRSTIAVARVLGISSSKPAGCRLELMATLRRS